MEIVLKLLVMLIPNDFVLASCWNISGRLSLGFSFLQLSMQAQEIAVAIVMNLGEMFFNIGLVSSTTKCCLTKLRLV